MGAGIEQGRSHGSWDRAGEVPNLSQTLTLNLYLTLVTKDPSTLYRYYGSVAAANRHNTMLSVS